MKIKNITVLGAGHGGYAAAADLTLRGFIVTLFTFSEEKRRILNENGNEIAYSGVWGEGRCRLNTVTNDMKEALDGAQIVVMTVPGPGHEKYLSEIKPYFTKEMILYMNPGHSGGALHAAHILGNGFQIAESNTLSYIARKRSDTEVFVSSSDKAVKVGVFPARRTKEVFAAVQAVFPHIVCAENVLESTFCNINAMFHPPGVLLNAGWIEHTHGDFKFYYEGITESIGNVIDRLDEERRKAARAYGIHLSDFGSGLYEAGSTSREGMEAHCAYTACQESRANKFIKAPESLNHRYMHEDICSGLVPMSELGRLAGVEVPVMDALIITAGALMKKDYRKEGVSLEKMGLSEKGYKEIIEYVY